MKRGQSAMEFLMTYGWAILVVLIILSALFYLGVFNPKTSNTYSIKAPMLIQDMSIKDNGILFKISGKQIESANVEDVYINGQSCSELDGFLYNVDISEGTYTGCSVDLSGYDRVSGSLEVNYTSKSGLSHTIMGDYSGRVEEGGIGDIIQDELNLDDEDLVFGWHGDVVQDFIGGLVGTEEGGLIVGNSEGILLDNIATNFTTGNGYTRIMFGNPDFSNFNSDDDFTVSVWAKLDANSKQCALVSENTYWSKGSWMITQSGGGSSLMFIIKNEDGEYKTTGFIDVATFDWTHFVGVKEGGNMKSYMNGVLVDSNSAPLGNYYNSTSPDDQYRTSFNIGCNYYYQLNGVIDETYVWNRALGPIEVNNLYNSYD